MSGVFFAPFVPQKGGNVVALAAKWYANQRQVSGSNVEWLVYEASNLRVNQSSTSVGSNLEAGAVSPGRSVQIHDQSRPDGQIGRITDLETEQIEATAVWGRETVAPPPCG